MMTSNERISDLLEMDFFGLKNSSQFFESDILSLVASDIPHILQETLTQRVKSCILSQEAAEELAEKIKEKGFSVVLPQDIQPDLTLIPEQFTPISVPKIHKVFCQLINELGRFPYCEEIANELSVAPDSIKRRKDVRARILECQQATNYVNWVMSKKEIADFCPSFPFSERRGAFISGFADLLRKFGADQLIVAINENSYLKYDCEGTPEESFATEVVKSVEEFLSHSERLAIYLWYFAKMDEETFVRACGAQNHEVLSWAFSFWYFSARRDGLWKIKEKLFEKKS